MGKKVKHFKVYIRHDNKLDSIYVEADSLEQVQWKVKSRYYDATILKIINREKEIKELPKTA